MAKLPKGTQFWAQDETIVRLFPPLRKGWAPRGQQAEVRISGRNARRVIFGGINLRTGERLLMTRRRQTAADFEQFLLLLRHQHPKGTIALLLDENRTHVGPPARAAAARLDIRLLSLPKRSPELNPADHLWRWAKQKLAANRQAVDIDTLAHFFVEGILRLSPMETLRRAGVLSKRFWLRKSMSD